MTQLVQNSDVAAAVDEGLRSSQRRQYPYPQTIALVDDGRLPAAEDFFSVQCRDLSSGGVSFYLDAAPQFDRLVVALGVPPDLRYLSARVVHVQEVHLNGFPKHLVGCRFDQRVEISAK